MFSGALGLGVSGGLGFKFQGFGGLGFRVWGLGTILLTVIINDRTNWKEFFSEITFF